MTRYYIEAFDADDMQILGNLDGQAALGERRAPRRCHAWSRLGTYKRPLHRRARRWQLVTDSGRVIARKSNPFFISQKELTDSPAQGPEGNGHDLPSCRLCGFPGTDEHTECPNCNPKELTE